MNQVLKRQIGNKTIFFNLNYNDTITQDLEEDSMNHSNIFDLMLWIKNGKMSCKIVSAESIINIFGISSRIFLFYIKI